MEIRHVRLEVFTSSRGKRALFEIVLFSILSGYIFYRSWLGMALIFAIASMFVSKRVLELEEEQKRKNAEAFVDLLKVLRRLSASGMSINSCFNQAETELQALYPDNNSWIIRSIRSLNTKLATDPDIAKHIIDWGKKDGLRDITDFGRVLQVVQSFGGSMTEKVSEITVSITQRMETERTIWVLASSKIFEQRIMYYLGYGMVLLLNFVMPDVFGVLYTTWVGRIVMTISFMLMLLGRRLGFELTRIEV